MKKTIQDLFTQEEWEFFKTEIASEIQEIANLPMSEDCAETELIYGAE